MSICLSIIQVKHESIFGKEIMVNVLILQTLCYKCHKKKSADEAARRAKINREKKDEEDNV
jgi:ABC-type transport system involved in cytochrome bd biosynthesis fused ATPase/permease subunit